MSSRNKIEPENLMHRFLAEAEPNFVAAIYADRKRRIAAFEATENAQRWAGFSGDSEFEAELAARKHALSHDIEFMENAAFTESIETVQRLGASLMASEARVIGNIDGPDTFRGRANILNKKGKIVATAPVDALGNFLVTAPADTGEVTLEIRDEHDRLIVVDGQPIKLEEELTIGRFFSISATGDTTPVTSTSPEAISMPDLEGMTLAAANSALDRLGSLNILTNEIFDAAIKNKVVDQTPAAGTALDEAGTVRLTISLGPEKKRKMPNLVGKTGEDAREGLAGLRVRSMAFLEVRNPKKAGAVVAQKPKPGTNVGAGTDVVLTLAVADRSMPDVTGRTKEEATEQLVPSFADKVKVTEEASRKKPGTVLRHVPPPRDMIVDGKVELIVAKKSEGRKAPVNKRMPNLAGMTRNRALKELEQVGLTKPVFDPTAARKRGAKVIDQSPKAGSTLKKGQNVSLEFGVKK